MNKCRRPEKEIKLPLALPEGFSFHVMGADYKDKKYVEIKFPKGLWWATGLISAAKGVIIQGPAYYCFWPEEFTVKPYQ